MRLMDTRKNIKKYYQFSSNSSFLSIFQRKNEKKSKNILPGMVLYAKIMSPLLWSMAWKVKGPSTFEFAPSRPWKNKNKIREIIIILKKTRVNYCGNWKDNSDFFLRFSCGKKSVSDQCSQLISSSDNKKILLTTRNVRLGSGRYATCKILILTCK